MISAREVTKLIELYREDSAYRKKIVYRILKTFKNFSFPKSCNLSRLKNKLPAQNAIRSRVEIDAKFKPATV